jgi:hypothetical protein
MKNQENNFIAGKNLQPGDLIRYKTSKLNSNYFVLERNENPNGECQIILIRQQIKDGKIIFSRPHSSTDVINKFNTKGKVSRDWEREVVLISRNNPIPSKSEIKFF